MSRTAPAAALLLALAVQAGADDVAAMLARADAYRLAPGALRVETQVAVYKAGKLEKERRYLVYVKPGRRSLVVSRSPAEQGQKVLMLGDDFWVVLPSTQRPIRITPAQKLLGDASIGDVATITWGEDYTGVVAGERDVGGMPCVRLSLRARRRAATYARIELDVARSDGHPVQAELFLASEKLAKRARFEMADVDGRPQVAAMTLVDEIETARETRIRYVERSRRSVPDEYYNPMFLSRTDLAE